MMILSKATIDAKQAVYKAGNLWEKRWLVTRRAFKPKILTLDVAFARLCRNKMLFLVMYRMTRFQALLITGFS